MKKKEETSSTTPITTPISTEQNTSTITPSDNNNQTIVEVKKEENKVATNNNNENKEEKKEGSPLTTSVEGFGVCADQNWKYRRRMEDAHFIDDGFNGDKNQGFFGVYDGHGGKEAAIFCSENLHKELAQQINQNGGSALFSNPDKVLGIMRATYLATDDKLKTAVPSHHGCTSVTCLISGSNSTNDRQLFTANVGDARAVLCRDGKAIRLTEEHKASETIEAKRITDAGGFIIHGRVNGQIIITRSLGDHLMKEFIIGDPFLNYQKLNEKDTWLIVACDGLWDVVEDQQAVDFVLENKHLNPVEVSKKLLIKALQDGTTDNLSIVVVKL